MIVEAGVACAVFIAAAEADREAADLCEDAVVAAAKRVSPRGERGSKRYVGITTAVRVRRAVPYEDFVQRY